MTFYKVRAVHDQTYFKPAYRDTQWLITPEQAKSYATQGGARAAAKGFLRMLDGEGYRKLRVSLGRDPRQTDLELVEFTASETGIASV